MSTRDMPGFSAGWEAQVQSSLDRFFADDSAWQQVAHEVTRSMKMRSSVHLLKEPMGKRMKFRVQVPKPYPGVQYRRSKDLNDKFDRYAKHGSTIVGSVEEDKEWIKVRNLYLPLRLGPVQILEPLSEANGDSAPSVSSAGDGKTSP